MSNFKGYIAILRDFDGSYIKTIDMTPAECSRLGIESYRVPYCPLAAVQLALDLEQKNARQNGDDFGLFTYNFSEGDASVMIVNVQSGSVDVYNNEVLYQELEMERIAG